MFTPLTKEQYDSAIQAGFNPEQIIANEKQRKAQNDEQPKGYFSRLGADYITAAKGIISDIQRPAELFEKGATPLKVAGAIAEAGLRTVGTVAEAAFAPITEAPIIKPALEAAGRVIAKIPGVDIIVDKATELARQYPELAKDFKSIVDIATVVIGAKAQKPTGALLTRTGVTLEESGIASAKAIKTNFVRELVSPIETKAIKEAQVFRTTESGKLFKKDIITPTALEEKMANEVVQISGISPKNTFQKNFNIIQENNVKFAKQLESDVAKYDFVITKKSVISNLNRAAEELKNSPLIVGDAEKTANRLIEGAKKIINENKGTGSGVLKARKQYDAWVLSQKPKAFDAATDNAFTIANKTIRDTLNTILDENAVNLGVKDSLRKQSTLFSALDNIAPKAAQEANTPLLRAFDRIGKVLGVKNRIVQAVAAAVGIGGLGAAATFAPAAVTIGGAGFVIYKAGKLVMSPEVRIALGKLLKESGYLLNPEDRKIMQNALDTYKE